MRVLTITVVLLLVSCKKPEPCFTASIAGHELMVNETVTFYSGCSKNGKDFSWDFGDGTTSTESTPSHTYSEVGTFDVELTHTKGLRSETQLQSFVVKPHLEGTINSHNWKFDFGTFAVATYSNEDKDYIINLYSDSTYSSDVCDYHPWNNRSTYVQFYIHEASLVNGTYNETGHWVNLYWYNDQDQTESALFVAHIIISELNEITGIARGTIYLGNEGDSTTLEGSFKLDFCN